MVASLRQKMETFLQPGSEVDWTDENLPKAPVRNRTPGLEANCLYFGHPEWGASYFQYCHRNARFRSRWQAATGPWDGRIVVDLGCGPGNVFATVGGRPEILLGVDVSPGALQMAAKIGYLPLLADAQDLPLVSEFADIVILNATIHHCDQMERVLAEAARLVKPGGILVSDHDPQLKAWNFRGPARWAWDFRLKAYLWMKKGFHRSVEEQTVALASEIHHEPGRGVTREFYHQVLEPLDFEVALHPHNHDVGAEALQGVIGRSDRKYRLAQLLSGLNPNSSEAALSILCRARKRLAEESVTSPEGQF